MDSQPHGQVSPEMQNLRHVASHDPQDPSAGEAYSLATREDTNNG